MNIESRTLTLAAAGATRIARSVSLRHCCAASAKEQPRWPHAKVLHAGWQCKGPAVPGPAAAAWPQWDGQAGVDALRGEASAAGDASRRRNVAMRWGAAL